MRGVLALLCSSISSLIQTIRCYTEVASRSNQQLILGILIFFVKYATFNLQCCALGARNPLYSIFSIILCCSLRRC